MKNQDIIQLSPVCVTDVINIKSRGVFLMKMLTFKVTAEKVKDIFGKRIEYYTTFWKSESVFYLFFLAAACGFSFLVLLWLLVFYPEVSSEPFEWGQYFKSIVISFVVIMSLIGIMIHGTTWRGRPEKIAGKIQRLVNDPELFWFNFHKETNEMTPLKGEIRWKRSSQVLTPENFLTMAYLKKEGGAQGIYQKILRWKNSNSAGGKRIYFRGRRRFPLSGMEIQADRQRRKVLGDRIGQKDGETIGYWMGNNAPAGDERGRKRRRAQFL